VNAKDQPHAFWCFSFAYKNPDEAGTAYERCRDLIFREDIDAGIYRIFLGGNCYVALVGIGIPEEPDVDRLTEICWKGESAQLPNEVVLTLALRHEQFRRPEGVRFERRASF